MAVYRNTAAQFIYTVSISIGNHNGLCFPIETQGMLTRMGLSFGIRCACGSLQRAPRPCIRKT